MQILMIKANRLYKNSFDGRIMVRLSLAKTDCDSILNILSEKLANRYFSLAEQFIKSKKDNHTYFLDAKCEVNLDGEALKIKRSSALKCGASLLKEYTVYDVLDKEAKMIKK